MREPHQTARERRARVKVCNMLLPDLFKTSLWNPDDPRFLFKDIKTGAVLLLAMELMAYGGAFGKDFDDQVVNSQAWKSPQLAHAYALWPFRVHAMTCVLKKQLQEKAGSSVVQSWMRVRCVATQDYHFSPCVAAISLWSGTPLISPAFGVKPKPKPPQAPTSPGQSGEKDSEEPEEEAKPKKKVVEDTYNTKGTPIPG